MLISDKMRKVELLPTQNYHDADYAPGNMHSPRDFSELHHLDFGDSATEYLVIKLHISEYF